MILKVVTTSICGSDQHVVRGRTTAPPVLILASRLREKCCPTFSRPVITAVTAGVGPGSTVYIAGAGPVGLACAASCHLLGAAVVIVGDMIPERLEQAKSFGCEVVDLRKDATLAQQLE